MSGYALLGSGAGALGLLVQDWIAGPCSAGCWAARLFWLPSAVPATASCGQGLSTCGFPGQGQCCIQPNSGLIQGVVAGRPFLMGAGMAFNPVHL